MPRSLAGRPLLHPDIAHAEAIAMDKRRECAKIDKFYARLPLSSPSSGSSPKAKLAPRTLHDIASTNPLLRNLLRELQGPRSR